MDQPPKESGFSSSWLLIAGLLLGAGAALLGFMAWDSSSKREHASAGSGAVIELTAANWRSEVLESKVPVVVDFGATWCGPCRDLAPTIDRLAERYKGKVKVCKVDVDKASDIAREYGISGIPNVMIFDAGQKQESLEGLRSENTYVRKIDALLAHLGGR